MKVTQSCPTFCDPHGLYSPWNSLGQNTGVGSLSLLQGIFPTQGLNPGLPALQAGSLSAEPQGKPHVLRDMYMKKFYLALLKWFIFTFFFFFCSLKLYVSVVSVMFWNYGFQTRLHQNQLDTLRQVQIPRSLPRPTESKVPELGLKHARFIKCSGGSDAAIWELFF